MDKNFLLIVLMCLLLACLAFGWLQNRHGSLGGSISLAKVLWLNLALALFLVIPLYLSWQPHIAVEVRYGFGLFAAGFILRAAIELPILVWTRLWKCEYGIAHDSLMMAVVLWLWWRCQTLSSPVTETPAAIFFIPLLVTALCCEILNAWLFSRAANPATGVYFAGDSEAFDTINRITWIEVALLYPGFSCGSSIELFHYKLSPMSARSLTSEIVPVAAVDDCLRNELFALFQRCYDCVTRERFEKDLAEKDFIVVLRDAAGSPRGFSTQSITTRQWEGRTIRVLFSGDTIIEPACWGSSELAKGWGRVAAKGLLEEPLSPLYWFLISKGYRTYLYLPLFFLNFHPRHDGSSGDKSLRLLHALAEDKFGSCYNPVSGIVKFSESMGQLKPNLSSIPEARQDDPHVRYFLARNPGYANGDELACLAEISLENTSSIGRRWLQQALREISACSN